MRVTSLVGPAFALAVALVAAGCGNSTGSDNTLTGTITFGTSSLDIGPLDTASLTLSGPTTKHAVTTHYGTFRFRGIPNGSYTLTATTPAGTSSWDLYVSGDSDVSLRMRPPGVFSEDEWSAVANILPWVVNDAGPDPIKRFAYHQPQRRWAPGTTLKVAFARRIGSGGSYTTTPYSGPAVGLSLQTIYEFADLTGLNVSVVPDADCGDSIDLCNFVISIVDDGSLPNGEVGLGELWVGRELGPNVQDDLNRYGSPYAQMAAIYIEESSATHPPTINHEIAHAFGLGHVADPDSLLYPYSGPTINLSPTEEQYLRDLYTIAPAELASAQAAASGGEAFAIFRDGHTEVRHGVPFKGVMQGP